MVLVWTEQGQLVMVPQQVLAQAQAKSQGQTMANISQRPATPTAGTAIRVSTATTVRLLCITSQWSFRGWAGKVICLTETQTGTVPRPPRPFYFRSEY